MPRRLYLLLLSMHLAVIVFHNTAGCMASSPATIPAWIHYLLNQSLLKWPGLLCGSATSYGFFAPQVGSSFLPQFQLYNRQGILIKTVRNPGLRSANGLLRYSSFLHRFQDLAPRRTRFQQPSKKRQRLLKATANSMALQIAKSFHSADHVLVRIMVYQPPRLYDDRRNRKGYTFLIYENTINCKL